MEIDNGKVDEITLALLYLTTFKDKYGLRAWKSHDSCWPALSPRPHHSVPLLVSRYLHRVRAGRSCWRSSVQITRR